MYHTVLTWQSHHVDYVKRVFGQAGVDLLLRIPCFVTDKPRSHTNFGDGFVHVMMKPDDFDDAFVFIHEFGHVWHAVKHPDLSLTAPTYRCEAAAYCAEIALALSSSTFHNRLMQRTLRWDPEGLCVVNNTPNDMKAADLIFEVMRGTYG